MGLPQLFRKFDPDLSGVVSRDEFLSGLVAHGVPVSRAEGDFLSQARAHAHAHTFISE